MEHTDAYIKSVLKAIAPLVQDLEAAGLLDVVGIYG